METWLFWGLAAASIVAALLVVGHRSAARALMMLAALLASTAGLFLLLSAPLTALVQMVLYAGGLVLIALPVTLFLNPADEVDDRGEIVHGGGPRRFGALLVVVLVAEIAWAFQHVRGADLPPVDALPPRGAGVVARTILVDHAPSVLLLLVLVLVVVVGASLLLRREVR